MISIKNKWWRAAAIAVLSVAILSIWLQVLIEASLVPAITNYCYKEEYSGQKECTPYNTHLFVAIKIAKVFLDPHFLTAIATILLAVVTWFLVLATNKLSEVASKQEETVKKQERAYLVAGPLYGIPNSSDKIGNWERSNRALASMFHGPYRMALLNFGRTAGYTTKVEWGFCKKEEWDSFGPNILVSEIVSRPQHREWWIAHQDHKSPNTVQDIIEPSRSVGTPKHYRHVEVPDRAPLVGSVFFGKLAYKDVFGDEHWSTFSFHMLDEHTDSIGRSLSDDHSEVPR